MISKPALGPEFIAPPGFFYTFAIGLSIRSYSPIKELSSTEGHGMLKGDMAVIVKICGITSLRDAMAAAEAGADALGFVFYEPSPRCVTLETAARIIARLPPSMVKVGLFVDAPEELVVRAIGECGLSLLQFHGAESPEYCVQFGLMSMKAFRIRDVESLQALPNYRTDAWLLDAYSPAKVGGTGETFNWDLAVQAQHLGRPIFLAGGLTPENVAEAIRRVRPYAVDVSSGVESAPGKKDPARVKAFIQAAKLAALLLSPH
jgi:phosphoribosylanthranilate isomerase